MSTSSHREHKIFGMSLGAEPKQVIALGGLLVLLAVVWLVMRNGDDGAVPQTAAKAPPGVKGLSEPDVPGGRRREPAKRQGSRQALTTVKEFKVSMKQDKDNPIVPGQTDPTIKFASLTKVQTVGMAGGGRSLFDFGSITPEADPKVVAAAAKPTKIFPKYGPDAPPPAVVLPGPPPPPPIPLKFYGFVNSVRLGEKRAFFMENEDIYIASEGEMMKSRYKLVKIGVNTVVLEDTQYKNNQQTIRLTEEAVAN